MRRRNMYYATGLPGWMRFGYSPGWDGMPPCVPYVAQGQFASDAPVGFPAPTWGMPTPEMEMQMLQAQLQGLSEQLGWIAERIEALSGAQNEE